MKQTVSESDFKEAFRQADRLSNFSWEGLSYLFEYLEEYEESCGEELELDVVALCCDYSEFGSARDAAIEYGWEPLPDYDEDEDEELEALEWLQDRTTVIECGNGGSVIVQVF
jgi:hypothetical protein